MTLPATCPCEIAPYSVHLRLLHLYQVMKHYIATHHNPLAYHETISTSSIPLQIANLRTLLIVCFPGTLLLSSVCNEDEFIVWICNKGSTQENRWYTWEGCGIHPKIDFEEDLPCCNLRKEEGEEGEEAEDGKRAPAPLKRGGVCRRQGKRSAYPLNKDTEVDGKVHQKTGIPLELGDGGLGSGAELTWYW